MYWQEIWCLAPCSRFPGGNNKLHHFSNDENLTLTWESSYFIFLNVSCFSFSRYGSKIEEPSGVKLKNVGERVRLWLSMDCMERWFVTLFLFLTQYSNLRRKEKVNVLPGCWVMYSCFFTPLFTHFYPYQNKEAVSRVRIMKIPCLLSMSSFRSISKRQSGSINLFQEFITRWLIFSSSSCLFINRNA